jgi:hypothetical protein
MAADGHARLLAVIESLSDEQLAEELALMELGSTGHVRRRSGGEQGWPLWQWPRGVTCQHFLERAHGVRALAKERVTAGDGPSC